MIHHDAVPERALLADLSMEVALEYHVPTILENLKLDALMPRRLTSSRSSFSL
jgi:hypothetical protein